MPEPRERVAGLRARFEAEPLVIRVRLEPYIVPLLELLDQVVTRLEEIDVRTQGNAGNDPLPQPSLRRGDPAQA